MIDAMEEGSDLLWPINPTTQVGLNSERMCSGDVADGREKWKKDMSIVVPIEISVI